jgi:hypothetical protein
MHHAISPLWCTSTNGARPRKGNAPSVFVSQAGDTIEIVLVQPADN